MDMMRVRREDLQALGRSLVPMAIYRLEEGQVRCETVSAGFVEFFGYPDADEAIRVMNGDMFRDTHPRDIARVEEEAFRFATEGGAFETVYRSKRPGTPGYRLVHAVGRRIVLEDGVGHALVWYVDEGDFGEGGIALGDDLRAVLGAGVHEGNALHRSTHDVLTGLPRLDQFLEAAGAVKDELNDQGQAAALLYLDLNDMKSYNRRFGFEEGDRLIRDVAHILAIVFGHERCARIGQDRFVVACPAAGVDEVVADVFDQIASLNGHRSLPVRVGIYLDSIDPVSPAEAIDRAKVACDEGRGSYSSVCNYFDHGMLVTAERRNYIIDNFDRALEEGWIKVFYQPIVRTTNGLVCDEEALSRWFDPEFGMLSPIDFIDVLEETKLIHRLDLYVIEQILAKMRVMEEEGLFVVPSSVNLSRSDFEACDIVEEVRKRVDAAGIGRDKITIEITESAIGGDYSFMKRQVERFHELGFSVWMDDFGSEYSSLDYLQSLPFDLIKLDMRFMRQFDDEKTKVIITEIVRMALSLGIDTVCEGVETAEQVAFLREVGCSKLQGYYFSRPNSLEEILDRYRTGRAIGFENPGEAPYYHALGSINLYDLASVARDRDAVLDLEGYFDSLPMAIIETDGDAFCVKRANPPFMTLFEGFFGRCAMGERMDVERLSTITNEFLYAVEACREAGVTRIVDDRMSNGTSVHMLVRHVANNPVTGATAVAVAALDTRDEGEGMPDVTFELVAHVLAADYRDLYYVDLANEWFVQYSCDAKRGKLTVARRGNDFFARARADARTRVFEPDRASFDATFRRDIVIGALDKRGTYTLTYRLLVDDRPTYMSMKVRRIAAADNHIIIGIADVDGEMRAKERERMLGRERAAFNLVQALSHDFVCIYSVDLETLAYREYAATADYGGLCIPVEGWDFFNASAENARRVIAPEDLPVFCGRFTEERVLEAIESEGIYTLRYHLALSGGYEGVELKALMVDADGKTQLVVSVMRAAEEGVG